MAHDVAETESIMVNAVTRDKTCNSLNKCFSYS